LDGCISSLRRRTAKSGIWREKETDISETGTR
jgi:hypothetical protein